MCTRLSVQIKFIEIERMLFSNIFQWQTHVLDKGGGAQVVSPAPLPPKCFCYIAYTVFYHVLSNSRPIQRYIAKTYTCLPTHLDD